MTVMLQKSGSFFRSVLTFILFSVLGIVVGILALYAWIRVESTAIFVRWQLLDSPHKFQHLTYANQLQVVAQAEDGNDYLYYSGTCDPTTDRQCREWVEAPAELEFDRLTKRIVQSGCKSAYDYYANNTDYSYSGLIQPRYPPQSESVPRECVISLEHYPTGGETLTYYVLLENGKIWKWIHKSPSMRYLGHAVLFTLVGLVIGIIIWVRYQRF